MSHPFTSWPFLAVLCLLLGGCASSTPVSEVKVAAIQDGNLRGPLGLRLEEVRFHDVVLSKALLDLSRAINAREGGPKFFWGSQVEMNPDGTQVAKKTLRLRLGSVTLGQVLDALSAETGWKYTFDHRGNYYYFSPPQ